MNNGNMKTKRIISKCLHLANNNNNSKASRLYTYRQCNSREQRLVTLVLRASFDPSRATFNLLMQGLRNHTRRIFTRVCSLICLFRTISPTIPDKHAQRVIYLRSNAHSDVQIHLQALQTIMIEWKLWKVHMNEDFIYYQTVEKSNTMMECSHHYLHRRYLHEYFAYEIQNNIFQSVMKNRGNNRHAKCKAPSDRNCFPNCHKARSTLSAAS